MPNLLRIMARFIAWTRSISLGLSAGLSDVGADLGAAGRRSRSSLPRTNVAGCGMASSVMASPRRLTRASTGRSWVGAGRDPRRGTTSPSFALSAYRATTTVPAPGGNRRRARCLLNRSCTLFRSLARVLRSRARYVQPGLCCTGHTKRFHLRTIRYGMATMGGYS